MTHTSLKAAAAALNLVLLLLASGCAHVAGAPGVPGALDGSGTATAPDATAATAAAGSSEAAAPGGVIAVAPVADATTADATPAARIVIEPDLPMAPTPLPASLGPRGRLDPLQDAQRNDLWQRVRDGFAMAEIDNELVRKWEQWYAKDPAYVQRMTERGGRYLFYIAEEVQRREMPFELALLPFIESAFNPQAQSRAAASGMWQFMPATGKDFELHQNLFRDDRRDVLASTRAALDYLQRLHGMFNDWHLALAAYNWGQGNVAKAIERNRKAGLPTDYASLRMPTETREYVPKLQAVKNIVLKPEAFALKLPVLENHPFFLTVAIERDIDVPLAARLAGMGVDAFQQLNPQMNKPVILAAGTPHVLLPYDNANQFLVSLAVYRGPLASWTAWVAPRNLKPGEAAQLIGIDEATLRDVNRIPPRMLVKAGSTLLVPRAAHVTVDVTEHVADHALLSLVAEARPQRRLQFKAGRQGDTVAAVAGRYRVSAAQVAQWNGVNAQGRFKAGQTIVVMVAGAEPAARGAKLASAKSPVLSAAATLPVAAATPRGAKLPAPRKIASSDRVIDKPGDRPGSKAASKTGTVAVAKAKPGPGKTAKAPTAAKAGATASAAPARLAHSGVQAAPR